MAVEIPKIQKFEELLKSIHKDSVITNYNTKLLTVSGENYGSLLIDVEVNIEDKKNNKKTLNLVAKVCPQNEWLKIMFASKITFKKEIGFYMGIVPTLINFQRENNIPEDNLLTIFPKCLNARINLNPKSDEVDDDAILLLENLKFNGYKLLNRQIGFNLKETEIVLKDLARFHAVPLAFKLKHPEDFKNKLMPHLNRVMIGREMYEDASIPDKFSESIYRHLNLNKEELKRFKDGMKLGYEFQLNFPSGNEQYATIVHCDFWLNNTMIKYENDNPVKNKMLDFQVATYGAPASDLVFFLYSSVHLETLLNHYDHFLQLYYVTFIDCLRELHCNTIEYTYDSFLEEINIYGPKEISQILVMFKPIFKDATKEDKMKNLTIDDMFTDDGLTDIYKNRLKLIVNHFFAKN